MPYEEGTTTDMTDADASREALNTAIEIPVGNNTPNKLALPVMYLAICGAVEVVLWL